MSHKLYRICLLSVVILAIVGGIFYYLNYVRDEADITEGTLVHREQSVETEGREACVVGGGGFYERYTLS